ncbi:hypothetical protein D3C87_2156050 [compost metagenome]
MRSRTRTSLSMASACWRWICTLDCQVMKASSRMEKREKIRMNVAVSLTVEVRQSWAKRLTVYSRIM